MSSDNCSSYEFDSGEASSDAESISEDDADVFAAHASMHRRDAPSFAWRVFNANSLSEIQNDALKEITTVIDCSASCARLLLMHFRWDRASLLAMIAEKGLDHVLHLARVVSRHECHATNVSPAETDKEVLCGICFCLGPSSEATSMACGHCYCNDCWKTHFRTQITDGNCRLLICMAEDCGAACDEAQVKALIADQPALCWRYCRSLLESYVDDGKFVKWCPVTPHCGRAIKVTEGTTICEPVCECGHRFCFACLSQAHSPCPCDIWRMWLEKTSDDSGTTHWVDANTKRCPKCKSNVEKSSGCNLVVCRCGQAFCWLCGGATGTNHTYTSISGHTCGRFKEEADARIRDAHKELKRFQHFHSRWQGHLDSHCLEVKQAQQVLNQLLVNQGRQPWAATNSVLAPSIVDFDWLSKAVKQLLTARQALSSSYVAAFYMFNGVTFQNDLSPEKCRLLGNLFEVAQGMLEEEVERLSKFIEAPVDGYPKALAASSNDESGNDASSRAAAHRQRVINSTVNIDNRLEKLYDFMEEEVLVLLASTSCSIAPYEGCSAYPLHVAKADPQKLKG